MLTMKKLLRTLQVNFPAMLELKFLLMRSARTMLNKPFEYDFNAISLFPDIDDALYLDIGANRGQSTDAILMGKPNVRIQMFEPNRLLYEPLEDMFKGNSRITLNNFGIGDKEISSPLFVPYYKKWMFDGLASFDRSEAEGWLRDNLFNFDEGKQTLRETVCNIRRLDDLNLDPFFIKMDIQGFEYQALQGGKETLKCNTPILLIEAPTKRIIEFLASLGYSTYAYEDSKFVPNRTGKLNTFFMTPEKLNMIGNQHVKTAWSHTPLSLLPPQSQLILRYPI